MAIPIILSQIEAEFQDFITNFAAYQETWKAAHGNFFQVLQVHPSLPRDGNTIRPDIPNLNWPSDQANNPIGSWAALGMPNDIPFVFTVNEYLGPNGDGFEIVAELELTNDTTQEVELWQRVINFGVEGHREKNWEVIHLEI